MTMNAPRVGQIWRKVDPRFVRFIRIEDVKQTRRGVAIRTVEKATNNNWFPTARSRLSHADHERFDGRRGGYEIVENARQKAEKPQC